MNPCILHVGRDAPLTSVCPTCHHPLGSHLYPSGLCIECVSAESVAIGLRLSMYVDVQERYNQLVNAHVFLVQRLERLENHVGIRGTAQSVMAERPSVDDQ